MSEPTDITNMLDAAATGDRAAVDRLFPLVYDELRRMARSALGREAPGHTLQATALVHEVYVRMIDQHRVRWQNRAHFVAIASHALRRILVDHARRKKSRKRGGDQLRVDIDVVATVTPGTDDIELIALDRALDRLAGEHPEKTRVVEMRFFGGMSHEDIASVMDVSVRTIERHWQFARAWLFRELADT